VIIRSNHQQGEYCLLLAGGDESGGGGRRAHEAASRLITEGVGDSLDGAFSEVK